MKIKRAQAGRVVAIILATAILISIITQVVRNQTADAPSDKQIEQITDLLDNDTASTPYRLIE